MKKAIKLAVLFLFIPVLFLSPSAKAAEERPSCTFVTRVQVLCKHGQTTVRRTYTKPEKMASVLNYLRMLRYRGMPEAEPRQPEDVYEITLQYSNGCQRVYRQWDYRYLSKNYRAWEKVEPARARLIYPLLLLLPGDL